MVEGSQIDWSAHQNDPVGVVTDYLAFDKAVSVAYDFAQSGRECTTAIVVVPDHDNGGMSLGTRRYRYDQFHPQDMASVLSEATLTAAGIHSILRKRIDRFNPDVDTIRYYLSTYFGIEKIHDTEMAALVDEFSDTLDRDRYTGELYIDSLGKPVIDTNNIDLAAIIGPMISERAGIGWTTNDHTGNDVPMFSFGFDPAPATIENTEIATLCARTLGIDLQEADSCLMVAVDRLFDAAQIVIDTDSASQSMGTCVITRGGGEAVLPLFKNIAIVDSDTMVLEGLTLYSHHRDMVFVPAQVKELFR
jgi:alkaline phosphatase